MSLVASVLSLFYTYSEASCCAETHTVTVNATVMSYIPTRTIELYCHFLLFKCIFPFLRSDVEPQRSVDQYAIRLQNSAKSGKWSVLPLDSLCRFHAVSVTQQGAVCSVKLIFFICMHTSIEFQLHCEICLPQFHV